MPCTPMNDCFIVVSPFETPDAFLALATRHAGAFPVLHLGRDSSIAREQLQILASHGQEFGVSYSVPLADVDLPEQVSLVVAPWGMELNLPDPVTPIWQVVSPVQAHEVMEAQAGAIALKGNEGAGRVGLDSSFIMFQELIDDAISHGTDVYIQGGVGVHSAAAYLALGARGVILDSQVALFPESHASDSLARLLGKLNGQETRLVGDQRVLKWPTMPSVDRMPFDQIDALFGGLDPEKNLIPLGQDVTLSQELVHRYRHLDALVAAMAQAAMGHIRQARFEPAIRRGSQFAQELGIDFPIIQGPMARVSDVAPFLNCVADAGALPMLAIGMATPETTAEMLHQAQDLVQPKPWGAGLLGFIPPAQFEAQAQQVLSITPPPTAVVIAGGRATQSAMFEKAGIRAFLHVPSSRLLDQYIKEGVRRFIFEGRESGGHIGPMYSTVLWEKQLLHLLDLDDLNSFQVIFAGGIHDALSSAFVSIMAASLAARGAMVGIVMGTAYLYTTEAVSSGAITPTFQELALAADDTVLLESAPGQETRVLPTPFSRAFAQEKARLEITEQDSMKRRIALEEMNLGRARVASKGLEHDPQTKELRRVGVNEQIERGEYMAGSIVPLMTARQSMLGLHESVTDDAADLLTTIEIPAWPSTPHTTGIRGLNGFRPHDEPIAIIGMAGIFPGADNVAEYWRNNLLGRDCITEVPPSRWDADIFYDPDTTDTDFVASKWGGFLTPQEFNPLEFGIAPATVGSVEPSQLLSLLVAARALEDAGIDVKTADLSETSVIFGTEAEGELASAYGSRVGLRQMIGTLPPEADEQMPKLDEDSFPGILSNVTTGRIANRLNCGGRNFTVDAACASTLAAVDVACLELWSDRANMVICGGADLHNSILDYAMFSATHALSRRGYCATFDQSGDGLTLGEGIGAVILKRLSDAERDGDRIYAVIRGVDGASDGRSLGLTAPNCRGQVTAIERAYLSAGVSPAELGMIEAHGTGTAVGDRTELAALSRVLLEAGALPGQVWVGSGKTQIGHTKCCAGVAGLIRVALSVKYGVVPPTLHLTKPVRSYVEGQSPVSFNASGEATVWMSDDRMAGVSGFGFGGTDFHAIVQNYGPDTVDAPAMTAWDYELFLVRGATMSDAQATLGKVRKLYQARHTTALKDVAYTLASASEDPVQICIVAGTWDDLLKKIDICLAGTPAPEVYYRSERDGKVAFLFPGQGSQHINMARGLFVMFPKLRDHLRGNEDYAEIMFPRTVFTDEGKAAQKATLTDTRNAQPSLGLVDTAIADLLAGFGVTPDAVAGHSYGEVAALSFAGAIPRNELPYLSRERAEAILQAIGSDPGTMAAVALPAATVQELLADENQVWAVNLNSPKQTVIAGTTPGVERVIASWRTKGINPTRLEVACAFHTPLVAGADSIFASALADTEITEPTIDVWSNTTADLYPSDPSTIRQWMARQIVNPVRFADELQAMYDDGVRVFIEAGPGAVLTGLARATLGDDITTITVEHAGSRDLQTFLRALGQYAATGRSLNTQALFQGRDPQSLDLDNPEKYAANPKTWMVDGLAAVPLPTWIEQGEKHPDRVPMYSPDSLHSLQTLVNNEIEGTLMNQESTATPLAQATPVQAAPAQAAPVQSAPAPVQGVPAQPVPTQAMPMAPMAAQPAAAQQMALAPVGYQPVPMAMPTSVDHMVYTYFQNIRAMVDDQRDILLTYLGYGAAPAAPMMQALPMAGPAPMQMMPAQAMPMQTMPMQSMPMQPMPMQAMPVQSAQPMSAQPIQAMPAQPETPVAAASSPDAAPAPQADIAAADGSAPAQAEPVPASDPGAYTGLPTLDSLTEEELRDIVIDVIADKTGYPTDMIGLDMDLEADLSIDSIKRLEIIGALGDRIQLPDTSGASDAEQSSALEQMTSIKTLRGMVAWLKDSTNQTQTATSETSETLAADTTAAPAPVTPTHTAPEVAAPTESASAQAPAPAEPTTTAPAPAESLAATSAPGSAPEDPMAALQPVDAEDDQVQLTRLTWQEKVTPFSTSGFRDITGRRFAITDDRGGYAQGLASELASLGAQATLVNPAVVGDLNGFDGLVIVNVSAAPQQFIIDDMFTLLKKMDQTTMGWLAVFDDTMGALVQAGTPDYSEIAGFSGFVKTFQHEYHNVWCTSVTAELPFDLMTFPKLAVSELIEPTRFPDIFYRGDTRIRHWPHLAPLTHDEPRELLDPDDVVIVLGGGQGISPTLVAALCADEPCHYVLVGRTMRNQEAAGQYPALGSVDQIQRYLAANEHFDTPKALVEKARSIAKVQSIEASIAKVEAAGGKAEYACADVRDPEQFRALISDLRSRFGHIDAVIHAAGILEDKLFRDKTLPSFQRVYATKVAPLRIICSDLLPGLKRLVLFSSTTAAFGNAGQCDYAAGNSTFDMLVSVLDARGENIQAVSFAWGGWKGAGMVSAGLEAEMKKRGLSLIPLAEGSQLFRDELRFGHDASLMVMGGEPSTVAEFLSQSLDQTMDAVAAHIS